MFYKLFFLMGLFQNQIDYNKHLKIHCNQIVNYIYLVFIFISIIHNVMINKKDNNLSEFLLENEIPFHVFSIFNYHTVNE